MAEAEQRFETSLAYRRQIGAGPVSVSSELANLANIAAARGDLKRAAALHLEEMDVVGDTDSMYFVVNALPDFAALAMKAGLDPDAARLFGAGDAVARASGLVPDPALELKEERAELRSRLGPDAFDAEFAQGSTLSAEKGLALAREVATRIAG
jgi:hypothetical protein